MGDFINGIMKPLVGEESGAEIANCIKSAASIEKQLSAAITNFKKKTTSATVKGVMNVGKIIISLPGQFKKCSSDLKGQVANLEKFKKQMTGTRILKNGIAWGKNVWKNWNDIYSNIQALMKNLPAKNWKAAGDNCGKIVHDVMGKTAPKIPTADPSPDDNTAAINQAAKHVQEKAALATVTSEAIPARPPMELIISLVQQEMML